MILFPHFERLSLISKGNLFFLKRLKALKIIFCSSFLVKKDFSSSLFFIFLFLLLFEIYVAKLFCFSKPRLFLFTTSVNITVIRVSNSESAWINVVIDLPTSKSLPNVRGFSHSIEVVRPSKPCGLWCLLHVNLIKFPVSSLFLYIYLYSYFEFILVWNLSHIFFM